MLKSCKIDSTSEDTAQDKSEELLDCESLATFDHVFFSPVRALFKSFTGLLPL